MRNSSVPLVSRKGSPAHRRLQTGRAVDSDTRDVLVEAYAEFVFIGDRIAEEALKEGALTGLAHTVVLERQFTTPCINLSPSVSSAAPQTSSPRFRCCAPAERAILSLTAPPPAHPLIPSRLFATHSLFILASPAPLLLSQHFRHSCRRHRFSAPDRQPSSPSPNIPTPTKSTRCSHPSQKTP